MTHLFSLIGILALTALHNSPASIDCGAKILTPKQRDVLAAYIASRYELARDVRIDDEGLVPGSCFKRLVARSSAPKRDLLLFLSPDGRFLTESLWDMTQSPEAERARAAVVAARALAKDPSPSRGPECATITVVVFSDFQCPFCKRVSELINMLPDTERKSIRVVFKHKPLSMHAWARPAALASICAALQTEDAFWALHDFFMENQHTISQDSLHERIMTFAATSSIIDGARLEACLASGAGETTLARDEKLADEYHVQTTPTLFVNGVRTVGLPVVDDFRALLRSAPIISGFSITNAAATQQ